MSSVSACGGGSAATFQATQAVRGVDSQRSQQLFARLDVNGDSSIDASELKSLTDFIGEQTGTSAVDADALLTAMDSDGDGSVSSTELTDNAQKLFDVLREQLMGVQRGMPAQPLDADAMFASIDTDGDGSISADEFKTGMQHGPGGPPPGGPPPAESAGGLLASLLEQYGSLGASATSSSTLLDVAA